MMIMLDHGGEKTLQTFLQIAVQVLKQKKKQLQVKVEFDKFPLKLAWAVDKNIYCKDGVKDAIQRMTPFLVESTAQHKLNKCTFSIFLMNMLTAGSSLDKLNINGYSFCSYPRSLSYNNDNPAFIALQGQQHGGVHIYCADSIEYEMMKLPPANLECLLYNFATYNIIIVVIYRPPSYPMSLFKIHLGKLPDWLASRTRTIAELAQLLSWATLTMMF